METLTFFAIQGFCALVLIWYILNLNDKTQGDKGLLALVRYPVEGGITVARRFRAKGRVHAKDDVKRRNFKEKRNGLIRKAQSDGDKKRHSGRKIKKIKGPLAKASEARKNIRNENLHAKKRVNLRVYNDHEDRATRVEGAAVEHGDIRKPRYREKSQSRRNAHTDHHDSSLQTP